MMSPVENFRRFSEVETCRRCGRLNTNPLTKNTHPQKNRLNWPVSCLPKVGSDSRVLLYGAPRGQLACYDRNVPFTACGGKARLCWVP